VIEEAAGGQNQGDGSADGHKNEGGKGHLAPAAARPNGQQSAADRHPAPCAEERLAAVVVGFSDGACGTRRARLVVPVDRAAGHVRQRIVQEGRASVLCVAFRHA
jgi:hypothetical protein